MVKVGIFTIIAAPMKLKKEINRLTGEDCCDQLGLPERYFNE